MDRDLIDRRRRTPCGPDPEDLEDCRAGRIGPDVVAWEFAGSERSGSPASDHDRARSLIQATVDGYAAALALPAGSSRSQRDGYQPNAPRNLRAYLLRAVLELTDQQIADELGLASRQHARRARLRGGKVAPKLAAGY